MKLLVHYPGDRPYTLEVLTGKTFKLQERKGGPGEIRISGADGSPPHVITFDEVICDSCNAEIGDEDPCYLEPSRLHCQECFEEYTKPYVKEKVGP